MTISRFFTVPCAITTPSTDPTDSDTDDEGVPEVVSDTVHTFCHVQPYRPAGDGERIVGREDASRARRVWWPEGTAVNYLSTVVLGTDHYAVVGDPDTWNVGSTGDHIAAVLIRQLTPTHPTGASS